MPLKVRAGRVGRGACTVVVDGGRPVVRKWYRDDLHIEFEKASALARIGEKTKAFKSPTPLRVDLQRSAIYFEYIPDCFPIADLYFAHMTENEAASKALARFRGAGRALAVIHRELTLSTSSDWRKMCCFSEAQLARLTSVRGIPSAFLHCDYGFSNVLIGGPESMDPSIVVIDASADYYVTKKSNIIGPIYIDLGRIWSAMSGLFSPIKHLRIRWRRVQLLKEAFVKGYEEESGMPLDRIVLQAFSRELASAKICDRFASALARSFVSRIVLSCPGWREY